MFSPKPRRDVDADEGVGTQSRLQSGGARTENPAATSPAHAAHGITSPHVVCAARRYLSPHSWGGQTSASLLKSRLSRLVLFLVNLGFILIVRFDLTFTAFAILFHSLTLSWFCLLLSPSTAADCMHAVSCDIHSALFHYILRSIFFAKKFFLIDFFPASCDRHTSAKIS